jgi:hypothetical protein
MVRPPRGPSFLTTYTCRYSSGRSPNRRPAAVVPLIVRTRIAPPLAATFRAGGIVGTLAPMDDPDKARRQRREVWHRHKRKYIARATARRRAMVRLTKLYPNVFARLLAEETSGLVNPSYSGNDLDSTSALGPES